MKRSVTVMAIVALAAIAPAACSGGKSSSSSTTTTTTTTNSSPAASPAATSAGSPAAASPAATSGAMKSAMTGAASASAGAKIFATNCSSCHQANGKGQAGVFPPLAGNPAVTGSATTVIHIVKDGLNGKIVVAGTTYNGQMPAWKGTLSDSDIASAQVTATK
jgi:mono/diheme cytochrome c family protein